MSSRAVGRFAAGDCVSLADVGLTPQLDNARRLDLDLAPLPTNSRVDCAARSLPAFAAPEQQPDAE